MERLILFLKGRWRKFFFFDYFDLELVVYVIIVVCVLYNFCLLYDDFDDGYMCDDDDGDEDDDFGYYLLDGRVE